MKSANYETGKLGEDIARKFLLSKNYTIITSNFKTKFGEIDLVASKNHILIFVEVKLKIGEDFGRPEEMINKRKLLQVQNTAVSFLQKYPLDKTNCDSYRIDAVCVVLAANKEIERIDHYENITFN